MEQLLFRDIEFPNELKLVLPLSAVNPNMPLPQKEPKDCSHIVIERVRRLATEPLAPVAPVKP